MVNKKVDLNDLIKRIDDLEGRLEKLDPISKRKLPSKKDQIKNIKDNRDEWSEKFPSVDIEFELAKMLDWLKANNKRKKDYKAFFRNWLRKSSNTMEVTKKGQTIHMFLDVRMKHVERKHQHTKICISSVKNVAKKERLLR